MLVVSNAAITDIVFVVVNMAVVVTSNSVIFGVVVVVVSMDVSCVV